MTVLEQYKALAYKIASERCDGSPVEFDDLAQEALIELWQLDESGDEEPWRLAAVAMRRRVEDLAFRSRPQLGEPSHRGKDIDPMRRHRVSTDDEDSFTEGDSIRWMRSNYGSHREYDKVLDRMCGETKPDPFERLPVEAADYLRKAMDGTATALSIVKQFRRRFEYKEMVLA